MDPLLYAILGSDRQILNGMEAQFDQQRVLSRFFSLLLPPSPSSNGRLHHRNEKPRPRSWKLEPNLTAIREGPTERKTALETTGSTIRRLSGIKIRCSSGKVDNMPATPDL
jgi:hypothetical protein